MNNYCNYKFTISYKEFLFSARYLSLLFRIAGLTCFFIRIVASFSRLFFAIASFRLSDSALLFIAFFRVNQESSASAARLMTFSGSESSALDRLTRFSVTSRSRARTYSAGGYTSSPSGPRGNKRIPSSLSFRNFCTRNFDAARVYALPMVSIGLESSSHPL